MSKYTTELRFICESLAGKTESEGYNSIDDIIQLAIPKIFDFPFELWDESYKNVLCTKILKHYYTREICAETYGLWKLYLSRKIQEIMPYYNKMYESANFEFNPLFDVDYTREYDRTGTEDRDSNGNDSNNNTNWRLYQDTPQGGLKNVEDMRYLTDATKVSNNGSNTYSNKSDVDTTEKYIETIKGKTANKSYAKMIMEYRKSLINIDIMVIDELQNLFMNIW